MANNIVQLKDKDDNNIFPIAGGMAADSINTAMLQDGAITTEKIAAGAVTSQNIDCATFSTTEKRVGTWIDGKPLYRKVLTRTLNVTADARYSDYFGGGYAEIIQAEGTIANSGGIIAIVGQPWVSASGTDAVKSGVIADNLHNGIFHLLASSSGTYIVKLAITYTKVTN